ncbi:hypothetical protein CPB86DRAFT_516688 [Serendipita vermifera]|nr:hypothetical protein CPB86DRAFT_516688 [Serendipita vermifera]
MSYIAIQAHNGRYLSLNGRHVDGPLGGGEVKLQPHLQDWEKFTRVDLGDDRIAFKSKAFEDVFLRFDGSLIPEGIILPDGGGMVNAQTPRGDWETYVTRDRGEGCVSIESAVFHERCLRADGTDEVNGQGKFGGNAEKWKIVEA